MNPLILFWFLIKEIFTKSFCCLCLSDLSEDAGTEIAFLLDGSDNIGKENFVRAKDFVYNMMNNVWTVCLRVSVVKQEITNKIKPCVCVVYILL